MKIRKNSIGYWLLLGLEEVTRDGVLEGFSYSGQIKYLSNLSNLAPYSNKSSFSDSIRKLRKNGFIEQESRDERESLLKLTKLGREYLGDIEEWDGKYRIVIWDIPEKKRRLRDLLRRKLREWKFKSIQKSVWVSKINVNVSLRKLISELEMEKWVVVIESDDPSLSVINFHDRG